MADTHPNYEQVLAALREKPEHLIQWAAIQMVALGAKTEWDHDDNYNCTEGLAGLAPAYGLPSVGDQDDAGLQFYGEAAIALGLETDYEPEDEWDGEAQKCKDGCGLAVDHEPPCRDKPGGRAL